MDEIYKYVTGRSGFFPWGVSDKELTEFIRNYCCHGNAILLHFELLKCIDKAKAIDQGNTELFVKLIELNNVAMNKDSLSNE